MINEHRCKSPVQGCLKPVWVIRWVWDGSTSNGEWRRLGRGMTSTEPKPYEEEVASGDGGMRIKEKNGQFD